LDYIYHIISFHVVTFFSVNSVTSIGEYSDSPGITLLCGYSSCKTIFPPLLFDVFQSTPIISLSWTQLGSTTADLSWCKSYDCTHLAIYLGMDGIKTISHLVFGAACSLDFSTCDTSSLRRKGNLNSDVGVTKDSKTQCTFGLWVSCLQHNCQCPTVKNKLHRKMQFQGQKN
jgi:hypothetical protein